MEAHALAFFKHLLATPSPSGYERPAQDAVRTYADAFADRVTTDLHGNVIAAKNPDTQPRLMFAGHCDQIGMIIRHIDDQGFVYAAPIGGWDPQQLVGQRMTVWTAGGPVRGVIARKPIHLLTDDEKKATLEMKDLWIDIAAKDKDDAAGLVAVGDPVTLELGFHEMRGGLATGPQMDNKCGLWVVIEALRRAAAQTLRCGVFGVSTVQEEIGLRGARTSAFGIDPEVAIAVDVTHATDCPTIDKNQHGDITLGGGPVVFRGPNMNPRVVERLVELAHGHAIPVQMSASGRATSNDANVLQINRAGVATGLVSVPNRYMHSAVEMVSLDDVDHAADLLAAFAVSLSPDDDFTP